MARTVISTSDEIVVKKHSAALYKDTIPKSYFLRNFIGKIKGGGQNGVFASNPNKPICILTDLEKDSGDRIYYDLFMRLAGSFIYGDNTLRGQEQKLVWYTDSVLIDQVRTGVDTGGKMSRKRTVHDLRERAKEGQTGLWAEFFDEVLFAYLAGDRGDDTTVWVLPAGWTGFAGNSFSSPDSDHVIYGGDATSDATLVQGDKFDLNCIDRAVAQANTIRPKLQKCEVEGGEPKFVCVMHEWQAYDLRTSTSTGQWLDIQKSAADRKDNPIYKEALGEYNGVILHKHEKVPYFTDWGGASVTGCRALFLGAQAAVVAFGEAGDGMRFKWHEEEEDRGNVLVIDSGTMVGVKKSTFNSKDFGVIAIDTAAAEPTGE